jgi:DNA-binding transcriptional LysR family regulator
VNNRAVDTRRLQLLLSLSRLGSMRAVADAHHLTTSTVSQQIAALAGETGAQLIEPDGRRVRLTPAGLRLADHAVMILAAIDRARLDLDPDAEPAGTVRVGGFATGIRVSLLPIVADLAAQYPDVNLVISEYEPIEAFALLTDDDLDLALTYDYNLAPDRGGVRGRSVAHGSSDQPRCEGSAAVYTRSGTDRVRGDTPWPSRLATVASRAGPDATAAGRGAAPAALASPRSGSLAVMPRDVAGLDSACRSTTGGRSQSTAGGPPSPYCSAGTANGWRSSCAYGNPRTWRGGRNTGRAARHVVTGRRWDQSAAWIPFRSGRTPARTRSS